MKRPRTDPEARSVRKTRDEVRALAKRVLERRVDAIVDEVVPEPVKEKLILLREQAFMDAVQIVFSHIPGVVVYRQNSGEYRVLHKDGSTSWVKGAPAGASDLVGIVGPEGWLLAIECKRSKKEKLSRAQQSYARMIHGHGGIYVWLHQRSNKLAESVALAAQKFELLLRERRAARVATP